ncbi:hypothetical protein PNOK_0748100 [Pyrrhoderma noxium]|uniref:Uncharacterized protein n=1 Tax=Pyrrhoderma noxium TaxID=2282107 RepID=A0A286UCY5_9AGAM|nr:hypothetical protein PNOK_0748100 [Pyrrhoderma noxium]
MPVLFERNQTQTHTPTPCTPVSQKVPICKTDLIGIGFIIFTIIFLLVFLERIVKCLKRRFRSSGENQNQGEAEKTSSIPLHRCLERSGSSYSGTQVSSRCLLIPWYSTFSSRKSEVWNKNETQQKRADEQPTEQVSIPPIVRVYDVEEQDITTIASFTDSGFSPGTFTPTRS